MNLDYLAYFVLLSVYVFAINPAFGSIFDLSRSNGYKEDMKLGLSIHAVLLCLAVVIFSVSWAVHRVF
jgi:hypothetical protein